MTTGFINVEITGDPDKSNVGRVGGGESQWSSSNARSLIHFCNPPLSPPMSSTQQAMRKIG